MASSTENVKLGVCTVLFDGVNLGYTKGGVEVSVETTTHEVTVDQFGETPIGELITGRKVSAKVPLAETTLDNLVAVMPGSTLLSDGAKAVGTLTFVTAPPVNNDKVTINGIDFTFKTTPVAPNEIAIPATINAAAAALASAINASGAGFSASSTNAAVTLTAKQRGVAGNVTITKTFTTTANLTVVNPVGGIDPTKAQVKVSSGININLLSVAKTLVLRPKGTSGADDFTIYKAACPGALSFTYSHDAERVYQSDFKGYILDNGDLFAVGDVTATGA
jgi:hypothetical protein